MGQMYWAGGRACIGLREFHNAIALGELGLPYALKAKDWGTVGKLRLDVAGCFLAIGQTRDARAYYEAYLLDLPRHREARKYEGRAHYNLGLLYRQVRKYDLAGAAYRQALHCFVERGDTRDIGDTHQNVAWMHLMQRKPEEALTHIELAASYRDRLPADFETEQLVLLAFYHAAIGELKVARDYLEPVRGGSVPATEAHLACAKWVDAQVLARAGQWPKAQAALHEATDHALNTRGIMMKRVVAMLLVVLSVLMVASVASAENGVKFTSVGRGATTLSGR